MEPILRHNTLLSHEDEPLEPQNTEPPVDAIHRLIDVGDAGLALRYDIFVSLSLLTNLLHLLVKEDRQDKHLALFRVTKADYTSVSVMQEKEIQNDYQSFWQTLKDALDGRVSTNVIPIMMRNILEYYFNFVHRQDKLWKALDELSEENPEFRALYRYVK